MNLKSYLAVVGLATVGLVTPTKGFLHQSKSSSASSIDPRFNRPTPLTGWHSSLHVSSGFTFEDGEQVLASLQKPLGLILEEETTDAGIMSVYIAEVSPGSSGAAVGLRRGDVVVAVQNADMRGRNLEYVMSAVQQAPKVLNIRVLRKSA